jgi:hypothetical protein
MTRLVRSFAIIAAAFVAAINFAAAQSSGAASIQDQAFGGAIGTPMTAQIQATNATQYKIVSGAMPAGLTLNSATGEVTGTPTAATTTTVTIQVTDTTFPQGRITFAICDPARGAPEFAVTDHENAYRAAVNLPNFGQFPVYISNHPSSITVDGVPPGAHGKGSVDGGAVWFDWTDDAFTGGDFPVTITATNAAGTTQHTFHWIIHPGLGQFITPDKGTYNVGETITLTAPFTAPVVVTGTPYAPLWGDKRATYVSGSGTDKLLFQYVVTADDPEQHGIRIDHLVLGDGTIAMSNGITATDLSATMTITGVGPPPFSIATNAPPIISDQTITAKQDVSMGAFIQAVGATLYQIASGMLPSGLSLNASNGLVSGTPTVSGNITVGIKVTGDAGTATGNVTFAISPDAPPVIGPVTDREDAFHLYGNIVPYREYHIPITNNATSVTATGVPSGILFSGQYNNAGFAWTDDRLGGGDFLVTITAANSAGAGTASFHWLIHPGVSGYIKPDKASYSVGDSITFVAPFSAPVVVTGTPYIPLWGTKRANYVGGSGTRSLTFQYTVAADDAAATGLYATSVNVGNGSIATSDGVSAQALIVQQVIGTSYPTFSIVASAPPPNNNPPPPTTTKTDQTITFSSPTGALIVGQSITLGAASSAGLPITYSVVSGDATITGNTLTPNSTAALIVRASSAGNETTNAASADVNFGNPQPAATPTRTAQQITLAVGSTDVAAENPFTLDATASSGLPVTYTVISGPATVAGNTITFTGTGNVTLRAAQEGDGTYAPAETTLTVTAHPVTRLVNISSRVHVTAGSDGATVGFAVTGTAPKKMLIRAVGESLAAFGVSDGVANPTLTLYGANSNVIATNSGWSGDAQIATAANSVGAFALSSGKTDAALLVTLQPGLYSAQVSSPDSGSVLLEVYDVAATDAVPTKQLINISTRAHVDASNQVFQGFVISGDRPKRVLVRAVGATLKTFGVGDGIADPSIKVYSGNDVIAANDDWGTTATGSSTVTLGTPADVATASAQVGAFGLPAASKDAAVLVTLQPGLYSAVVTGSDAQSGTVLVEAYEVP